MPLARRQLLAIGGIGLAAGLAGALFGVLRLHSAGSAAALLGQPFVDLEGRTTWLRDWPAPVLLCNFWATWCEPCREEIPLLVAAKQQFAHVGLEIAGIGFDDAVKLREFAGKYDIRYPVLIGPAGTPNLLRSLGDKPAALPFSVLLDRERRISYRKLGAWSKSELEREILAAIG